MIGKTDLKLTKVIGNEECTLKKNYLLLYSRLKYPQRSHVLLLQNKSYRNCVNQKQFEYQNFIKEYRTIMLHQIV